MPRSIRIEIEFDGATGAVTRIKSVGGALVDLRQTAEKEGPRFGRIMEVAIGNVAATAISNLHAKLAQIPGAIIAAGSDVQDQLADLSAITGIMGDDLERLGNTAVAEGIRTGVSARDQIEAYKLLASNIEIAAIGGVAGLEKLGKEVVTLTQATGGKLGLAEASDVVAASINQYGLEADQSARIVNVLAAGSKFGAAEIGDLGASLKQAGTTAALANISFEATVGALEVMSQNALKGSEAGVGLRNVITILRTETKKLADAGIKDLNLETDGLAATLVRLKPLLSDASAMAKIFGRENLNAAAILIKNAEAVERMTERVTDTNTAQEQAAIQMDTYNGSMARLTELIKGIAIGGFSALSDELTAVVDATISAVMWIRSHDDEMLMAVKIVAILTVAIASYSAVIKAATIRTKALAFAERIAATAKSLYAAATGRATAAQLAFNTAIKSNPIGLLVSVLATAAAAFFLFFNRADAATGEIEEQREQIRGLTTDLEKLQSAQLFSRYAELKEKLASVTDELGSLAAAQAQILLNRQIGQATETDTLEHHADLEKQRIALGERRAEIQDGITETEALGAISLEARRDVLRAQVEELQAQDKITGELADKLRELAALEREILQIKEGRTGTDDDDLKAIEARSLKRRALEIRLMKEGHEKRLAEIELQIDEEIEKYRKEYAEEFPALFGELESQLQEGKTRLFAAIASLGEHAVPVEVKVGADVELEVGDIDFGAALEDGLVRLDGALNAVNHNLSALRQRYLEASSAQERWDIFRKITELEALQMEAESLGETISIMSGGAVDAFTALGEGIGASLAGIESSMDDMAKAVKLIIADIAVTIGRMLLKQAAALAVAGLWGKAARLAAAGTGLIILGSVIRSTIQRNQERERAAERLAARADRPAQGRRFADGGLVRGPGSAVSDSIAARLSAGEFVVNAAATRRNYPLLAAINEGGVLQITRGSGFDQAGLERAVSRAVVGALGRVEFRARGRALETVRTREETLYKMAGIE